MNRFARMPFLIQLVLVFGLAMLIPAIYAGVSRDFFAGRVFMYAGLLSITLALLVAVTVYRPEDEKRRAGAWAARNQLLSLLAAYTLLPILLAVPFYEVTGNTTFLNAYFEMVSALTTTGATLFDDPERLANVVHLWRAVVGWLGGLIAWICAIAILAPLNLGGFEVLSDRHIEKELRASVRFIDIAAAPERIERFTNQFFPVYVALTIALWAVLTALGDDPFVALNHAMSVMATSGISPVGGLSGGSAGLAGEVVIASFLAFAVSRKFFVPSRARIDTLPLSEDPELRLALFLIIIVPAFLFLRHWFGVLEVEGEWTVTRALSALWGGIFMTISFLTTAGFESETWQNARAWSGLAAPGVLLIGLAIFGGGVATTAGGVKLVRIYALSRHGEREIEKLLMPNSIGGAGAHARRIRREGAQVAWVYFMVFALTIAVVMMLLSLFGHNFETAAIFTVAALTTTGPLISAAGDTALSFDALGGVEKMILSMTMILGRLELLAIIALFNPEFWRR